MIFASTTLERALARGEITGWDAARYYFVPIIFTTVISIPCWLLRPRYSIHPKPLVTLIQFALQLLAGLLAYHGVKKCFRTNEQIDSSDFISRMVILGFPVFCEVMVLGLAATFILLHIALRLFSGGNPVILVAILSPLMTFVTFALINQSLKRFGAEIETFQHSHTR